MSLVITKWSALHEPAGVRSCVTLAELGAWLEQRATVDDTGEGFSPVSFDGDYRAKENVELVHMLGLDFDDGDFDCQAWERYRGIAHTTRHHQRVKNGKPACPRWRVLLCLSRPVTREEHAQLWLWATRQGGGTLDRTARDPSRYWFYPPKGSAVVTLEGEVLDVDEVLEQVPPSPVVAPVAASSAERADAWRAARGAARESNGGGGVSRVRGYLAACCQVIAATPQGERNAAMAKIAYDCGGLSHYGVTLGEMERELLGAARSAGWRDDVRGKTESTCRRQLEEGATKPRELGNREEPRMDGFAAFAVGREPSAEPWPRIELLTGADLAKRLPPLEHLVEELALVAGGGAPHLTAGYGFSGKSVAKQAQALALAAAVPVWGAYRVSEPRRVVHVDLEQGDRLTKRRYQRLAAAMGIQLAELGDALAVAVMPNLRLEPGHEDAWLRLMDGRDWMLIDSLRAASPGTDENSSDMRRGLDMLGSLSDRTGCRPEFIHHARKPPQGEHGGGRYSVRGSSAIYDACDSVYVFSAERGQPVLVEVVKARSHGELPEPVCLVIEDVEVDGDDRAGLRVSVRGVELLREQRGLAEDQQREKRSRLDAEAIRAALARCPTGLGSEAIKGLTGMSGGRFAVAIALMGTEVAVRWDRKTKIHTLTGRRS
jgi:hypothetical protein